MINLDGVEYDVGMIYPTLKRTAKILEGKNSGTAINGRVIRDILGTAISYSFEIQSINGKEDQYDALYEQLIQPVDSHIIILPYGQSTITIEGRLTQLEDTYYGKNGAAKWKGAKVTLDYMQPAIEVE